DLNIYHAGARMYDPVIGRFTSQDRFKEKYPSMSPYQYAALNPILFVDVNGDSINVASIQKFDRENGTNILGAITSDLEAATGLTLSVTDNGQLIFDTDKDGNAIVATDQNGNTIGSGEARNRLTSAISTTKQAFATITKGSSSVPGTGSPLIRLNPDQINSFIDGTSSGLDSRTLGFGFTFLHEVLHSNVGISARDDQSRFGATGPVVDIMNTIRSELGGNFGQRRSYIGLRLSPNGPAFLPFDANSFNRLERGLIPSPGSKFIKISN
ncbi:MAG: RHS repeat-associated core domain-containing protein, partial [Balneolaceae bacterium]